MKTMLVLLFMLFSLLLCAQEMDISPNISHSSVDANGMVHLRWMYVPEFTGTSECFYKIGTGAWNQVNGALEPISGTYEALVPYSFGQRMRYRLRVTTESEMGEVSSLHAAYSDADAFPQTLANMAYICTDPEGDMMVGTNNNLDIRETYVSATANKLYFTMKNPTGLYPTFNSATSYNAYMCNIINPESVLVDSVTYALIYTTVPLLLSNGVYKIGVDLNTQMPTFTRLGAIQAQVSGGALHLACNLSVLTSDPSFGAWPNEYNGLVLSATTMSLAISPTLAIDFCDYSNPAGVLFVDNVYEVAMNHPPAVNFISYIPETGTISFLYSDQDGDIPLIAEVETSDGTIVQAYPLNPMLIESNWYAQMPVGYNGHLTWRFSDNGFTMVNGEYNPTATDDNLLTPSPIICQMPNPYTPTTAFTIKGVTHSPLKVSLFNIRGQKVRDVYAGIPNSTEQNLDLDGSLGSGIYFLKIEQDNRTHNHKFVITK